MESQKDTWHYLTTAQPSISYSFAGDLVRVSKSSTSILFSVPIAKYHFDASFSQDSIFVYPIWGETSWEYTTLNCPLINAGQKGFNEQPPLLTLYALCSSNISPSHLMFIFNFNFVYLCFLSLLSHAFNFFSAYCFQIIVCDVSLLLGISSSLSLRISAELMPPLSNVWMDIQSIYSNSGNASKILQTPKDVCTNWKSQNNDIGAVNGTEGGCIQLTLSFSSFIALFAPDLFIVFWQSSLGLPGACSALVNWCKL